MTSSNFKMFLITYTACISVFLMRFYYHIIFLQCMVLKAISRKKAAPWIFAHYQKIYNFYPILMKPGGNDHLMGLSFLPSFIWIGQQL